MGWFSSSKKVENNFSNLPALQQVGSMVGQVPQNPVPAFGVPSLNAPSFNNPSEVSQVAKEIGGSGPTSRNEPFFVRIDKFNEAKTSLVEISKKMREMENILVKLGEIKQKEDEEIESWKQDMKRVKTYLEEINETVFSRL